MANTVSYTGDTITYYIPVTNDGPYPNTNVLVDSFVVSGGQTYTGYATNKGTFDSGTMVWTIGDMVGNQQVWLKLYYVVSDIGLAPFTLSATVSGDINDNIFDDTISLSVESTTAPPSGGGVESIGHGGYVDVSENDTQCTNGITEWRLNEESVVNGILVSWDELTGQGVFKFEDLTANITGTYDLFCVVGVDEYQISCAVPFTIPCLLESAAIFDHTIESVVYADLSVDDVAVLQAQWPELVIADYCWHVLKNSLGNVTSGLPLSCDETVDDKLTIESIASPINTGSPATGVTFPLTPEDDDIHTAIFTNGQAWFKYDKPGTTWLVQGFIEFGTPFSGDYPDLNLLPTLAQAGGNVTGSIDLSAETFTLNTPTLFDGVYSSLTARPTIPATIGNVTGSLDLDTGVLNLSAPVGAADNWGTQVIEHDGGSLSSGDGTVGNPLLVAVTKTDVGLGNVPNVDATDRTSHTGVQAISTVTGLQTALDSKVEEAPNDANSYVRSGLAWSVLPENSVDRVVMTGSILVDFDGVGKTQPEVRLYLPKGTNMLTYELVEVSIVPTQVLRVQLFTITGNTLSVDYNPPVANVINNSITITGGTEIGDGYYLQLTAPAGTPGMTRVDITLYFEREEALTP